MSEKKGDRVMGVYPHPDQEGTPKYEIKYIVMGKPRSEYRKTKVLAEARAQQLRDKIEGASRVREAGFGYTAKEWLDVMWSMAERLTQEPSKETAASAAALANLARSAQYYVELGHNSGTGKPKDDDEDISKLSNNELNERLKKAGISIAK